VWGEMAFILNITATIVKKSIDLYRRSEFTAATAVVSRWQQSAALSSQYCLVYTVRLILKKENGQNRAPLSAHADMFDLLSGHYDEESACNVCLRSLNWNIRM
jgi:hypothetical protein